MRNPRWLQKLQSKREPIKQANSMPLVRQVEIILFDAYEDTTLTTTHLMSIIVVCVMYLRSRAMPDYLRDKLMNSVEFAEHVLSKEGLMNPRTLERWDLDLATTDPVQEAEHTNNTIDLIVDAIEIPDDISDLDDPGPQE